MSDMGPGDKVRVYISDELIRVRPEATVRQMARPLASERLVVVEGDQVHGIVSERNLMLAIAGGQDLDATTAADLG
jgi:predicted transcriptional regulator